MTDNEFLEVVEAVCKRPKLYTPEGSFFEVISFIDGVGTADADFESGYHSSLTPFLLWLAEPDDQGRRFPVSTQALKSRFDSDETAIREFACLYRRYFEEREARDG